jgi:hypothetical protein
LLNKRRFFEFLKNTFGLVKNKQKFPLKKAFLALFPTRKHLNSFDQNEAEAKRINCNLKEGLLVLMEKQIFLVCLPSV